MNEEVVQCSGALKQIRKNVRAKVILQELEFSKNAHNIFCKVNTYALFFHCVGYYIFTAVY